MRRETERRAHTAEQLRCSASDSSTGRQPPYQGTRTDLSQTWQEGLAAQRCLNRLYTALSFYLPLNDLPQGRHAQVASSYELSLMIRDDNAVVWYNLACMRARLGQKKDAMEALAKSLEHGFNRYELLETDTDLDPLRKREDFKALLATVPAS